MGSGLKNAGIPFRPKAATLERQVLVELYVDEGLTVAEVARRLGSTDNTVVRALEQHGIPQRAPRRPVSKEIVRRLYVDEGLSDEEIAERVHLLAKSVRRMRARWGIPTRPRHRMAEDLARSTLVELYVDRACRWTRSPGGWAARRGR